MLHVYKPTLPLHSLYWLLGGIALSLYFVISLYYGLTSQGGWQIRFEYSIIPLLVLGAGWLGFDALYFFFSKKEDLVIEESHFTIGSSLHAYSDIVSICEALNIGRVTFTKQNGDQVKIYTSIYQDLTWYDFILEQILPRITSEAFQRIRNQETVFFGKELSLSNMAVTIKGKSIPLRDVTAIRSQIDRDGADIITIEAGKKKHEIAFYDIENVSSFMSIVSELLHNN